MAIVRFWGLRSELGQGHCPQCGQSLREKERLKNHMQTVHENFCDVCFHRTRFPRKLNLFMHLYNENYIEHGHSEVLGIKE